MKRMYSSIVLLGVVMLSGCVYVGQPLNKPNPMQAAMTRNQIGMEYLRMGDIQKAQVEFESASRLSPNLAETYNGLGLALAAQGDNERADANFRKAIRISGDTSGQFHNDYGTFLYHQKNFEAACTQFMAATNDSLYANRAAAYENLGLCQEQRHALPLAKDAFFHALRLSANMPVSNLELAEVFYDLGDMEHAQLGYGQYVRLMRHQPQSARGLWLGWRLAHARHDTAAMASTSLALQNLYPQSQEFFEYQKFSRHVPPTNP